MAKKELILMILAETPMEEELFALLSTEYEVVCTDDEETGLRALNRLREKTAAVLVDIDIAQQTDFSFFRQVNRDVLYAAIPVVAVSPRTPTARDLECLDMGAADIFASPFEGKLLLKRLNNVIRAKDSVTFHEVERMLKVLPSNIYLKDAEGKYVFATHYWHHLDKSDDPDWTIRGKTDPQIRKDREKAIQAQEADKKILASGQGTRYIIEINADNQREFLEIIKEPFFDEDGAVKGIVGLINNVTEQQLLKMDLEERSKTDELTGLLNRRSYQEYILQLFRDGKFPVAFISVDCNNLKQINDTYGHLVGDEFLRMSALLFRMTMPSRAAIFRMGGDEFVIIVQGAGEEEAQRLVEIMREKESAFQIREQPLSIAIGYAILNSAKDDINACVDAADQAMYRDKNRIKQEMEEAEMEEEEGTGI
ncbi:MAG: diguanylate cyclase [Schwartzia sp.]|nr:diguanylate cyclase [Schwartzia sp. (in: firmicutes)]